MHRLTLFAVIGLLTINGGAIGQSADPPTSHITAIACDILPAPLQIDVQILDDSEQNVAYKRMFEKELRSKGAELSGTAEAIAILDIKTVREIQGTPAGLAYEKRAEREETGIEQEGNISLHGNVWSNTDDSVLGGRKQRSGKFSLNQLQLSASINSRTDGRCLWRGEVLHDLHGDEDPDALTRKLIPILARALGKTIRNKPITVNP